MLEASLRTPMLILAALDLLAGAVLGAQSHETRHLLLAAMMIACSLIFTYALVARGAMVRLRDPLRVAAFFNLVLAFMPVTFVMSYLSGTGRGGAGAVEFVVGCGLAALCVIILQGLGRLPR